MKSLLIMATGVLVLVACSKVEPTDTVESLMANPERLKALRAQCKVDHAKLGDARCNIVAEATRRRFMGDGKSPYTNDPAPQPAYPVSTPAGSASKD